LHPNTLLQQVKKGIEEFQHAQPGKPHGIVAPGLNITPKWKAPPQDWYKANWDAGVDRKNGKLGLRVVVWDSLGNFCAAKSKMWLGWLDPTLTEAWAALMAIDLCHELGVQRMILEGDAKILVDAVNSTKRDDSCRGQLVADIQLSLTNFPAWQMVYAPRQVNGIAHCLA
jgi:hypothetical protein